MCHISFLFFYYFGKILRLFSSIKNDRLCTSDFLLNTTQSQWSQVPNTYMHTYLHTYIICQIKKKKKKNPT